jgi:hypothetical protein
MRIPAFLKGGFWFFSVCVLIAACDTPPEVAPTFTRQPSLAPSLTSLPILPEEEAGAQLGHSEPTSAAIAAEGQQPEDVPTPFLATQATIPLVVMAEDSTMLDAVYYGSAVRPAPALLVLPGGGEASALAGRLQSAGYHVLMLQERDDISVLVSDALAGLETLAALPDVTNLLVLGIGHGTVPALAACAGNARCGGVAIIDPLPEDRLMSLQDAANAIGTLPLLILSGQNSAQTAQTLNRPGSVLQPIPADGDLLIPLVEWLQTTF